MYRQKRSKDVKNAWHDLQVHYGSVEQLLNAAALSQLLAEASGGSWSCVPPRKNEPGSSRTKMLATTFWRCTKVQCGDWPRRQCKIVDSCEGKRASITLISCVWNAGQGHWRQLVFCTTTGEPRIKVAPHILQDLHRGAYKGCDGADL